MAAADPRAIRFLDLIVTSRCNLACAYCYQNTKGRRRLEWPAAKAGLDRLLASESRDLSIGFIGGEALLEKALIDRAVRYVDRHRRPGQQIRFSVGTNGVLLDAETAAFLARHHVDTYLSFDGVREAQDLRGEGTFDVLDGRLDALRRSHPEFYRRHLRISWTLLPSTVHYLPESFRYFLGKGVREIGFSPDSTDTSAWHPSRIDELEAAFAEVFEDSVRHYQATGEIVLREFRGVGPVDNRSRPLCGVGSGEKLSVDADGRAYGCVMFARSYQTLTPFLDRRLRPMELGRIDAPTFESRLATYPEAARRAEIFDHKEKKYSSYGRCVDCDFMASCSVCPVSIGKQAGQDDPHRVPDFLCAFNLVTRRLGRRFPRRPITNPSGRPMPPLMAKIHHAASLRRR